MRDLLSGIIMMTALWTINLRIAGTSNVPLFSKETIFKNSFLEKTVPESIAPYITILVIIVLTVITKLILDFYMSSKSGFLLRAVGDNEKLVTSLAKDQGNTKI